MSTMTNSQDTIVDLPLLLVGTQPMPGSSNDILSPQLLTPFSLVPSFQSTFLLTMMHLKLLVLVPVHRRPGWTIVLSIHCADLNLSLEGSDEGSEGGRVSSIRLTKWGFLYLYCPLVSN
jgi:hypothetical protein